MDWNSEHLEDFGINDSTLDAMEGYFEEQADIPDLEWEDTYLFIETL